MLPWEAIVENSRSHVVEPLKPLCRVPRLGHNCDNCGCVELFKFLYEMITKWVSTNVFPYFCVAYFTINHEQYFMPCNRQHSSPDELIACSHWHSAKDYGSLSSLSQSKLLRIMQIYLHPKVCKYKDADCQFKSCEFLGIKSHKYVQDDMMLRRKFILYILDVMFKSYVPLIKKNLSLVSLNFALERVHRKATEENEHDDAMKIYQFHIDFLLSIRTRFDNYIMSVRDNIECVFLHRHALMLNQALIFKSKVDVLSKHYTSVNAFMCKLDSIDIDCEGCFGRFANNLIISTVHYKCCPSCFLQAIVTCIIRSSFTYGAELTLSCSPFGYYGGTITLFTPRNLNIIVNAMEQSFISKNSQCRICEINILGDSSSSSTVVKFTRDQLETIANFKKTWDDAYHYMLYLQTQSLRQMIDDKKQQLKLVVEDVLRPKCPKCKAIYGSHDACAAIHCRCGNTYCGICFKFPEGDIYAHINRCLTDLVPKLHKLLSYSYQISGPFVSVATSTHSITLYRACNIVELLLANRDESATILQAVCDDNGVEGGDCVPILSGRRLIPYIKEIMKSPSAYINANNIALVRAIDDFVPGDIVDPVANINYSVHMFNQDYGHMTGAELFNIDEYKPVIDYRHIPVEGVLIEEAPEEASLGEASDVDAAEAAAAAARLRFAREVLTEQEPDLLHAVLDDFVVDAIVQNPDIIRVVLAGPNFIIFRGVEFLVEIDELHV